MKNKKTKYFFRTLFVFFLIFIALIISYESGYYETKASNRAILTREAMEQFEADLEKGNVIDVKNYLKPESIDYSNRITKIGNKVSNAVSNIMTKGISGLFDTLKGLFW